MDHTIDSVMLWAVRNGYDDIVQALLKRGANPLATDEKGNTLYDISGWWLLSGNPHVGRFKELEHMCVEASLFETGKFGRYPPWNVQKVRRQFAQLYAVLNAEFGRYCESRHSEK